MIKKPYLFIFLFIFTYSCGFKVIKQEEIRNFIGVDTLKFISLDGVYKALGHKNGRNSKKPAYTDHYFSGDYPVELVDQKSGVFSSQLSLLIESK